MACELGHTETIKVLIEKDAVTLQRDWNGRSALFLACKKGFTEIVNFITREHFYYI